MSDPNSTSKPATPAMESIDTSADAPLHEKTSTIIEWGYSGKAMRAQCLLYWVITIAVLAGMGYLSFINMIPATMFKIAWGGAVGFILLLWLQFICLYCYRTWTIRYRLTEHRLDTIQGLFTKTTDTMELLYIDDQTKILTLWDRIFNGGVGKIILYSSVDKTDRVNRLIGVDDPQKIFDLINDARARVRAKRGFITG